MVKRIVKLTFHPENVPAFQAIFENSKAAIRNFSGCFSVELLRDTDRPHVFFTLSIWENEAALEAYRHSALFEKTWAKTKALFSEKPAAWTVEVVDGSVAADHTAPGTFSRASGTKKNREDRTLIF